MSGRNSIQNVDAQAHAIAAAEQLHGAIICGGYLSLPEPEKRRFDPFMRAMGDYWNGGEGADPLEVLAAHASAKAAFDEMQQRTAGASSGETPKPAETTPHFSDAVVSSVGTDALPAPAGVITTVHPATLSPHPMNQKLFAHASTQEQQALAEDVAAHGVFKPLLVAGDGCASPRGTIYAGSRRREAALTAGLMAPAIYRDGLSEDEEVATIIQDNLADQHARKLTHGQRYILEEELRARHGKRQGQRTDLEGRAATQEDLDGSPAKSSRAPKTVEEIAKRAGQKPNAVAQRQLVLGSKLVPPLLMTLVNDGRIPISTAATMVRASQMECGDKLDDPAALRQAKAKLQAQVRQLVETKGSTGKKKSKAKKKPTAADSKRPAAAAPHHHPSADTTASAVLRMEMRKNGIYTPGFFDTFERAAEDLMAFSMALQRRIGRDASDRSMALLKEVQAGRDPRTLPPIMPPELKRLLTLHRLISKVLLPVVTGKVRRRFVKILKVLGPFERGLEPESIPPGMGVAS